MKRPPEFDALIVKYLPYVRTLVTRYAPPGEREDLAQETLARCFAQWARYDAGASPAPWIRFQMMMARTAARKRKRVEDICADAGPDALAAIAIPPRAEEAVDARRILAAAVAGRDGAVMARIAMGDSLAEAGRALGFGREAARQRADRGGAALRAQFGEAA